MRVVRFRHEHAEAGAAQRGQDLADAARERRRQAFGRLVEQQKLGPRHHRPRQRHHLLLPAAQLAGAAVGERRSSGISA